MRNIEILSGLAETKYPDYVGIISVEGMENRLDINRLCKDNGINMEGYYLLGVGLIGGEFHSGMKNDMVTCTVLLLENSVYGNAYKEIESNLIKADSVNAVSKSFNMKFADLTKYIKRFSFMAATEMIDNIKEMKVQEG